MIVITELTESKLVRALETCRAKPSEAARILYFPFASQATLHTRALEKRPLVLEAIHRHLPEYGGQTFWCDDGDIFILTPQALSKQARELMVEVAGLLGTEATAAFAQFLECQLHVNRLLALLETKAAARQRKAQEEQKRREEAELQQKRMQILQTPGLQATSAADIQARRRQHEVPEILIIEDDAFTRKLVENVLKSRFRLTGLGTAEAALATYQHHAPDVVFLDINLPDVTGHELLQQIMRMDPEAYVVMLSGNADKANIVTAIQNGAKGFVAKPFTKDKLFQYIDRCPTVTAIAKS